MTPPTGATEPPRATRASSRSTYPSRSAATAVSVIGDSHSEDADTSAPAPAPEPAPEPETAPEQPPLHVMPVSTDEMPASADSVTTDGTDSVAGGNQVVAPVEVPVTVGGTPSP